MFGGTECFSITATFCCFFSSLPPKKHFPPSHSYTLHVFLTVSLKTLVVLHVSLELVPVCFTCTSVPVSTRVCVGVPMVPLSFD